MYVPNLRKASRNMTKHMFRGKNGESHFPRASSYTPNVETERTIYNNPTFILGGVSMEVMYLQKSAAEQVSRKRVLDGMFWNV
jgi:hypothetical protein